MPDFTGPIQHKRGTSTEWAASGVPLREGELGYDTTVKRSKMGDGSSLWASLPWQTPDGATIAELEGLAAAVEGAVAPVDAATAATLANPTSASRGVLNTAIGGVAAPVVEGAITARAAAESDPFIPRRSMPVTTDAPTIVYTSHADESSPSGFTTKLPFTDPRLSGRGYIHGTRSISGNVCAINVANGYLGSKDYAVGTEFGTYAPFAIEFYHYGLGLCLDTVGLQATYQWQVYVDGRPVSAAPITMDPTKTGVSFGQYAKMTWATARLRRIRIELPANIGPRGVWTKTANDSVVPAPAAGPTFFALGDSWTEGVGSDPTVGLRFPKALELFIGKEFYLGGQGGTGYVNQGSGVSSEFGSAARLNAVADAQPDYLIVAGTSNDDGNAASVQAAAAALYAQVAIRSPKTKIIVLGPQNTSTSVSAQREAVRAAVIAAATAAPNVVLIIDPIAEQWITGSGTTSAPGTAGNASVFVGGTTGSDGAHLNAAGYDYWAARVAARLNALVSA